nr:hypothetical protein [Tanacetum cinerariifolium]
RRRDPRAQCKGAKQREPLQRRGVRRRRVPRSFSSVYQREEPAQRRAAAGHRALPAHLLRALAGLGSYFAGAWAKTGCRAANIAAGSH